MSEDYSRENITQEIPSYRSPYFFYFHSLANGTSMAEEHEDVVSAKKGEEIT